MRRVSASFILVLPTLLLCAKVLGADRPKVYRCPKVSVPPVVDGKLCDPAWRTAPPVGLVLSTTGKPATKKTTARMCWDDTNLYVCFDCEDTDIWGTYTERDDLVYAEEVVEIFASPSCSLTSYYEINVSPRNTVFDARIQDPIEGHPTTSVNTWNCEGIRTAVVVDGTLDNRTDVDRGWTAELAIPFAGLATHTARRGERWRLNLYRIDLTPKPAEFQAWSPTFFKPAAFHIPEWFGTVFFCGEPTSEEDSVK